MSDLLSDVPEKKTRTVLYEDAGQKFTGPGRITGANRLSRRFELCKVFGERGKPGLNADIQNAAESVRMVTDNDFEILGVNHTSALCTYNAEGGITMTTAGADLDTMILLPHLDANQSAWTQVTWGTDRETRWECHIKTGAAVTAQILWAKLGLTNTSTTATDNDQIMIRYQNGVSSGKWVVTSSIGGTDTPTVTSFVVALATEYHFVVEIDATRVARVYINGELVHTSGALTDATDLIPYVGVTASGAAAAKTITVYGETISRVVA